jgi:indole-3-glycerol phosphate synthase
MIYEAKLAGADAILLIMAALTDSEFKQFHKTADELGLDVLVETHNEEEVKRALEYGTIIGVNNRNLQTFEEDITTCGRLLPLIPSDKVTVAESAIRSHKDYEYLQSLSFDAALIGEAFMREANVKAAVSKLRYGE